MECKSDTRSCLMQCLFAAARHSSFVINAAGRLGCNSVTATPPVAIARVKLIKLERPFEPRPGTDRQQSHDSDQPGQRFWNKKVKVMRKYLRGHHCAGLPDYWKHICECTARLYNSRSQFHKFRYPSFSTFQSSVYWMSIISADSSNMSKAHLREGRYIKSCEDVVTTDIWK